VRENEGYEGDPYQPDDRYLSIIFSSRGCQKWLLAQSTKPIRPLASRLLVMNSKGVAESEPDESLGEIKANKIMLLVNKISFGSMAGRTNTAAYLFLANTMLR
jgi:hypothetical protein